MATMMIKPQQRVHITLRSPGSKSKTVTVYGPTLDEVLKLITSLVGQETPAPKRKVAV